MNIFEVEDVTLKRIFIHSGVIVNGYLGGDTCVPGEQPVMLQVDVLVKKTNTVAATPSSSFSFLR